MKRMVTKTDIVETVNKAIEDGDISVSSETTLYKHNIGGGTVTGAANIVSERETSYTTTNEIWQDYIRGKIKAVSFSGPTTIYVGVLFTSQHAAYTTPITSLQVVGITSGTSLGTADISSFNRDTVTPLA